MYCLVVVFPCTGILFHLIYSNQSYFLKTHFNIKHLSMRFSFEQTLSFGFPYQNSASICLLCNTCQTILPLHPPALDHPTVWWAVQLWSSISCDILHFSVTSSSFGTKIFLSFLFSTTRILYSYLTDENQFLPLSSLLSRFMIYKLPSTQLLDVISFHVITCFDFIR